MEDICRANYLCNELGMDTITTGAMVSCAMELFEEGYLPEKDLGYPSNSAIKTCSSFLKILPTGRNRRSYGPGRSNFWWKIWTP